MIYQCFLIPLYKWNVLVYYYKTAYHTKEILDNLKLIGCNQECLEDARENMEKDSFNTGLCYSNFKNRKTIIVIAKTTSPEQFVNSWLHEAKHLLSHIEQEFNIDPYSEEAAYLCGYIGQLMFLEARKFMCNCYKKLI